MDLFTKIILICVYLMEFFLPLYFATDKTNYSRYDSSCIAVLERIEELHPGLRQLLETNGMSVQAHESPLRVAVDQRGEQTLNHDAKTTGGIKHFALDWTVPQS